MLVLQTRALLRYKRNDLLDRLGNPSRQGKNFISATFGKLVEKGLEQTTELAEEHHFPKRRK